MNREEAIGWLKVINTKKFGWDEFALQESQREIRERCEQGVREAIDMAIEALRDRPTGEWIEAELDKGFRVCSVCKNKGYKDKMAWRTDFVKSYLNFCPNCGAIMKGGTT